MNNKAIIAMSGGVDSSVAAYLMKKKGFDCIGVTMKLYDVEDIKLSEDSSCCSEDDINDARAVADKLSIQHYVTNFKEQFKEKVIDYFVTTYERGATPNPCIECNRHLKFKCLFDEMISRGCDYIVTGHYAVVEEKDGWYYLKKGADESKDQSYVLYSLTQEQLSHIIFPLGAYSKTEIREIAEENNFINSHKKDSQDICFVPDGDYASFIERYTGKIYPKGNFVDINGNVLGEHQGIIKYTTGQRKGLGVALGKPAYVINKDVEANTVILGDNEMLFSTQLTADNFNWIVPVDFIEIRCKAKVRYNMREQDATAKINEDGTVTVVFDKPQRAVTKGQSVVLYDGTVVLGGGTII